MTDSADIDDDSVKAQLILMRAEARHYAAQAAKAEKESRLYPIITIVTFTGFAAVLVGIGAWLGTYLPHH